MTINSIPKVFSHSLPAVLPMAASATLLSVVCPTWAADKRPNIVMLMTDDAASLLLGFNAERKITGISLMSMAGD